MSDHPLDGVTTHGLRKEFGHQRALDGVNLRVAPGAAYLMAGENGAGKSTLLRILLGLQEATAGSVSVLGVDPAVDGAGVRALVGYMPDRVDFEHGWMSVDAALRFHARYRPRWDPAYAAELIGQLELPRDRRLSGLSKGQRRRLQLVLTLAHRPPIVVMDEPTDALDPRMRERFAQLLSAYLADTDATLILSTHAIADVKSIPTDVGILRQGQLVLQCKREALRNRLVRVSAEVPNDWLPPRAIGVRTISEEHRGGVLRAVLWASPEEACALLESAGAATTSLDALTLSEAVVAMLAAPPSWTPEAVEVEIALLPGGVL
ncbi:MAG: ABC transporter ATP-binding protein [Gemmatimonadota bacterium]